jgi:hypothetical protein
MSPPQSSVSGPVLSCYQSRERQTLTKTLWNGFVVTVAPGSDDLDSACRITLRDSRGAIVFSDEGFNTELHPGTGRDIDNDGEPDAILGIDSGGGNRCCWEYTIISFSPQPHIIATLPPTSFEFTSDSNGRTLIRMTEPFYALGTSMAASPTVTVIQQFRSGKLADVTVEYCKAILSDPSESHTSNVLQHLYCGEIDEASRIIRDKWPVSEQASIRSRMKKEIEARWPEIAARLTDW